jgi:hypothetical protein
MQTLEINKLTDHLSSQPNVSDKCGERRPCVHVRSQLSCPTPAKADSLERERVLTPRAQYPLLSRCQLLGRLDCKAVQLLSALNLPIRECFAALSIRATCNERPDMLVVITGATKVE